MEKGQKADNDRQKKRKRGGKDAPTSSYCPVTLAPTSSFKSGCTSASSSLPSFSRYTLSSSSSAPATALPFSPSASASVTGVDEDSAGGCGAVEEDASPICTSPSLSLAGWAALVRFRTLRRSLRSFSNSFNFLLTGRSFSLSSGVAMSSASYSVGNLTLRY